MAKYKVLKTYYSSTQNKQLVEGQVLDLDDKQSKILDDAIQIYEPGYLEKIEEEVKKRGPKPKVKDGD